MKRRNKAILAAGLLAGACALTGCSAKEEDSGKPKVLTTFTVVADMVRQVGGDRIEVTSIKDVTPVPHNGCTVPKRRRG